MRFTSLTGSRKIVPEASLCGSGVEGADDWTAEAGAGFPAGVEAGCCAYNAAQCRLALDLNFFAEGAMRTKLCHKVQFLSRPDRADPATDFARFTQPVFRPLL